MYKTINRIYSTTVTLLNTNLKANIDVICDVTTILSTILFLSSVGLFKSAFKDGPSRFSPGPIISSENSPDYSFGP